MHPYVFSSNCVSIHRNDNEHYDSAKRVLPNRYPTTRKLNIQLRLLCCIRYHNTTKNKYHSGTPTLIVIVFMLQLDIEG